MHGFKDTDGMLIKMLEQMQKQFMIVFTKCDRANDRELTEAIEVAKEIQGKFKMMSFYVHFTSARDDFGITELRNHFLCIDKLPRSLGSLLVMSLHTPN